jgi:hypothetical protein
MLKVLAQEAQGLSSGNHGEKQDDFKADKDVPRTSMEGLDVDKLHILLHVVWGVLYMFPKELHQILGQVVGWGASGVNSGPGGGARTVQEASNLMATAVV